MAEERLYIGSYTHGGAFVPDASGAGISSVVFNHETGRFGEVRHELNVVNPSYLVSRDSWLWAVSERFEQPGEIHALRVTAGGRLEPLGSASTGGLASCHVLAESDHLCVSSYLDGRVRRWTRDGGALGDITMDDQRTGSGPNEARQEAAHCHQAITDPGGRWLWVTDLGSDTIWIYRGDANALAGSVSVPGGYGPRHMALGPDGATLWVWCELAAHLIQIRIDTDTGQGRIVADYDIAAMSGVPNLCDGSAIRWHPDQQYFLLAARTPGVVLVVDPGAQGVTILGQVDCTGGTPRDACFSGDGGWLIIAEQAGNRLTAHRLAEGVPDSVPVDAVSVGTPVCLAPAAKKSAEEGLKK